MSAILIKGGTVVTPERASTLDVLIEGEKIGRVAPDLPAHGARVVDAGGMLVLPGLVDSHVHLRDPGAIYKEDFTSGTQAALAGGITTVLVMPNDVPPTSTLGALEEKRAIACTKAYADYGFFFGATSDNVEEAARAKDIVGLKVFMGASTGDLLVAEAGDLLRHFEAFPTDRVIAVHAEDDAALRHFQEVWRGHAHSCTRPPVCAALAVGRALTLAEHVGRRVHICHVSTEWELDLIRAARRRGVKVTCETTPHHLFLSDEDEPRLGPLGRMNPPLRPPADVEALWDSLDEIDTIATDHAPHTWDEKLRADCPAGVPGMETLLPLLLTAVARRRLALTDVARLIAWNPAAIFGLRGKGLIAEGHSADLVLVDPDAEWVLAPPFMTRCNWSPFAGTSVRGRIENVFLRGTEVLSQGRILVEAGFGQEVELCPEGGP